MFTNDKLTLILYHIWLPTPLPLDPVPSVCPFSPSSVKFILQLLGCLIPLLPYEPRTPLSWAVLGSDSWRQGWVLFVGSPQLVFESDIRRVKVVSSPASGSTWPWVRAQEFSTSYLCGHENSLNLCEPLSLLPRAGKPPASLTVLSGLREIAPLELPG